MRCPVLAITALLPGEKPLLLSFDRMAERETAVVLKEHLSKGIAELKEAGAE